MRNKKKKSGFVDFMTTLPGLLTALAAILTAVAGLYVAFRQSDNTPKTDIEVISTTPLPPDSLVELVRLKGQMRITDRVAVQLFDVDTLKGKSKKDEPPSHEFNKKLDDREHIFEQILARAGVSGYTVQSILDMNQDQWENFLDSLDDIKKEKVKEIPFAKFEVYIDSNKDETYAKKYYFQGEPLIIKAGDRNVTLEVAVINNTKTTVEAESVKVRVK